MFLILCYLEPHSIVQDKHFIIFQLNEQLICMMTVKLVEIKFQTIDPLKTYIGKKTIY
jgi:hypothetical protein